MNNFFNRICFILCLVLTSGTSFAQEQTAMFEFGKLTSFDKITSGVKDKGTPLKWFNVNTTKETWTVKKDGSLLCSGQPIGVARSEKQYENFILHVEWKHNEPGGNSGVFAWSSAVPGSNRLPDGVEIQMLELDWVNLNLRDGVKPPIAYVHGELFGVAGVETVPDNPRGTRSKSVENRAKGKGEWNSYDVICVDGVIKLSVNGKFVNGLSKSTQKKGYICLESEGAQLEFRNFKLIELAPGVTSAEQIAPLLP
jgi:3-keto-disaccharide hydrolase